MDKVQIMESHSFKKVNSISISPCATEMSIKIFIDGGMAEFEIVTVLDHSCLKVGISENIIEVCIRWQWVYTSRNCSDQGISAIFDMQTFIHKIITLDIKVTISNF